MFQAIWNQLLPSSLGVLTQKICSFFHTFEFKKITYTVHPRKLTWQWKNTNVNRRYIFKQLFVRCRVGFRGCICKACSWKWIEIALSHRASLCLSTFTCGWWPNIGIIESTKTWSQRDHRTHHRQQQSYDHKFWSIHYIHSHSALSNYSSLT